MSISIAWKRYQEASIMLANAWGTYGYQHPFVSRLEVITSRRYHIWALMALRQAAAS